MTTDKATEDAFFEAVRAGDVSAATVLLDRHCDLVRARADGGTALHVAAWEDRPLMVELLLDRGADLAARDDRHGMLPIAWANEHGHMKMVRMLYERGATVPFQLKAAFGLLEALAAAIASPTTKIDEVRGYGTALHFAALWGQPDAVRQLLEAGADPGLRNENGERALTVAKRQMQPESRDTMLVIASRKMEIQEGCAKAAGILEAHGAPE